MFIVNEAAARRYWPGREAVGQRLNGGEVVGVVRDSKERGLTADPRPTIYKPLSQNYMPELAAQWLSINITCSDTGTIESPTKMSGACEFPKGRGKWTATKK